MLADEPTGNRDLRIERARSRDVAGALGVAVRTTARAVSIILLLRSPLAAGACQAGRSSSSARRSDCQQTLRNWLRQDEGGHPRAHPDADLLVHRMPLQHPETWLRAPPHPTARLPTAILRPGQRGLTTMCQRKRVNSTGWIDLGRFNQRGIGLRLWRGSRGRRPPVWWV